MVLVRDLAASVDLVVLVDGFEHIQHSAMLYTH
jgi:hypothetical protein